MLDVPSEHGLLFRIHSDPKEDACRCPGCVGWTTSGSPCPTSSRRTGSWSTCSAASTSTPSGPSSPDDDWMATTSTCTPEPVMVENRWFRCGDQAVFEVFHYSAPDQRTAPAAQQRRRRPPRGAVRRRPRRRSRPPAPQAACRSSTDRRRARARGRGQPVDLLPRPVGHAVRAGLHPEGKAWDREHAEQDDDLTESQRRASTRVADYLREAILGGSCRATGSARRRSPSGSAPAGCRCARHCGCSRRRA